MRKRRFRPPPFLSSKCMEMPPRDVFPGGWREEEYPLSSPLPASVWFSRVWTQSFFIQDALPLSSFSRDNALLFLFVSNIFEKEERRGSPFFSEVLE